MATGTETLNGRGPKDVEAHTGNDTLTASESGTAIASTVLVSLTFTLEE